VRQSRKRIAKEKGTLALVRQFKAFVAASVVLAAAGCSSVHFGMAHDEDEPTKDTTDYGQVAALKAIGGSAVFGKIRVIDRGDGASMLVSMMNVPPGDYRIAFTERPNCSSPNGFSAGAPWAPAGRDPHTLIPVLSVNSENRVELSLRVPAVHAKGPNGVAGRSVIVYAGRNVTEAKPGVPNERMACGVFEAGHGLQF
jgi:Cu/Zn superoxide dismutase